MSQQNPTTGELRVRASFNPAGDKTVEEFKTKISELIDLVEMIKGFDPRLAALAQTSLEEACMWAVKLATTPKPVVEPHAIDSAEDVKIKEE